MPERFAKEARAVAAEAEGEARASGAATVEAHHLLLALAGNATFLAGDVLRAADLDYAAIEQALEDEVVQALSAVGVSVGVLPARARLPSGNRPRWAASGKAALERAVDAARARGDRRITSQHILLGVLAAEHGTVPRALRLTGVEPAKLIAATHAGMSRS